MREHATVYLQYYISQSQCNTVAGPGSHLYEMLWSKLLYTHITSTLTWLHSHFYSYFISHHFHFLLTSFHFHSHFHFYSTSPPLPLLLTLLLQCLTSSLVHNVQHSHHPRLHTARSTSLVTTPKVVKIKNITKHRFVFDTMIQILTETVFSSKILKKIALRKMFWSLFVRSCEEEKKIGEIRLLLLFDIWLFC